MWKIFINFFGDEKPSNISDYNYDKRLTLSVCNQVCKCESIGVCGEMCEQPL